MTNIVFSPTLQAPVSLNNPTGVTSLLSDPSTVVAQHNPSPNQGVLTLPGVAVQLAFGVSTNGGAMLVTGVAPAVISRTVTPRIPSTGNVSLAGNAPSLSVSAGTVLTFPRVMLVGVGGDQSYGSNASTGYPAWTTAAAGSAANTAIQTIGAYDIAILAGVFEGWDSSGSRDRENLTQALGKQATTYTITKNTTRATKVFYYEIMCATVATNPYAQWQALVDANNWYLYESAGGVGTKTPAGGGQVFINYSVAWPGNIGSAGAGSSICGTNYGTTSTGSPTGAQGPARSFGNYVAIKLFMRGYTGDSRFSFNIQMGSPSAAGPFLDEAFVALDGAGPVPNSYLDGINLAPGSQQGVFPALDTVQPVMARGIHNMFDQMQIMLSQFGTPGHTYYNFANFAQYANKYQFGTATLTCGLENTLHGGLLESVLGKDASSWECFQIGNPTTGNTTYASGWPNLKDNYYQGMDFCQQPKLVGLGTWLPSADGTISTSWPIGAGTTLSTVTAGTAREYQLLRYGLCTALLDDGYFAAGCNGYDWAKPRWYDEYGDDSLTQVNVKRGYLGTALETRPTSPFWAQGPLGVWKRAFTGGVAIVNPRGNGAQTIALGATYTKLLGTQQPSINNGANVTSVTIPDADGLILLGPNADGVSISGGIVTINRAAGGFTTKATAAPLYYNNFEAQNVGDTPVACGLTASFDGTSVLVASDISYTGTKSLKGVYPPNHDSFPEISVTSAGGILQCCISAWVYWQYTSSYSSNPIFKLCRAGSDINNLYHGRPQFYQTIRPNSDGSCTGGDEGYITDSGVVAVSNAVFNIGTPQPMPHGGQWNFVQYKYQLNNPASGTNGQCIMLCNGKNVFPQPMVNQAGGALTYGKMRDSTSTALINWIILFFDGISSSNGIQPGVNMNVDELFCDSTLNEVIVTDNATYSSSTKFLSLICSGWTDKQIVGTNAALTTLFPSGSTANFHIFNNLGAEVINFSKVMP